MPKHPSRDYLIAAISFAIVVLLFILASCEGGAIVATATPNLPVVTDAPTLWPTNTPVDITPTPDGPHWSTDCLPEGIIPSNPNPCPVNYTHHSFDGKTVQEIPAGMGLQINPNENGILSVPDAPYHEGATRLHTYGMVGEFGVTETVEMFGGHCYTFNVPVTINLLNSTHWENFIFYSRLHPTNSAPVDLNEHPAVLVNGNSAALAESYPNRIYWAFQPAGNVTVEWEVGFRSVWATSAGGNYVDFEAFYIQEQFNTQICN